MYDCIKISNDYATEYITLRYYNHATEIKHRAIIKRDNKWIVYICLVVNSNCIRKQRRIFCKIQ